ncbi:MAG TPA: Mur ligase family protein [Patescibacteria group bacterium]|nr:Mur ligase family protein [Patescibacteria group bacterium]
MDILFIITSSLFFLWLLRQLFFWLWVWQQNDYRQDRFFASFKKNFRKYHLFSVLFPIGKWALFFAYGYVIFHDDFLLVYHSLIIGLYAILTFFLLREIYLNHLKKPHITLRVTILIALTLTVVLLLFAIPLFDRFFWLLCIDLITPFIVLFFVILLSFPIEIYQDWQIEKAGQKIRRFPKLLVIAVTGSVEKSRTKDYIATLLGKKFRVVKTHGRQNTMIGVAKAILDEITEKTQIFVAEISAYKQGEIGMISSLIQPKIGVLTTINSYYLPLFKTLERIKRTNYELVESLPKDGYCLYNGNSKQTLSLYKKSRKGKVLYRTGNLQSKNAKEFIAYDIVQTQRGISFSVIFQARSMRFHLHHGQHLEAFLPALFLALSLGLSENEIKRRIVLVK